MRVIEVDTDVYAAIWNKRAAGEETENVILKRILIEDSKRLIIEKKDELEIGFYDVRNNVKFFEGFEIFRNYKGKEYKAIASSGYWVRQDNQKKYSSLNSLNKSIVAGTENVWNGNWKFCSQNNRIKSINTLRRID